MVEGFDTGDEGWKLRVYTVQKTRGKEKPLDYILTKRTPSHKPTGRCCKSNGSVNHISEDYEEALKPQA
jgi:hypothetical protein